MGLLAPDNYEFLLEAEKIGDLLEGVFGSLDRIGAQMEIDGEQINISEADSLRALGNIGGEMSKEFEYQLPDGEAQLYVEKKYKLLPLYRLELKSSDLLENRDEILQELEENGYDLI